MDYHKPAECLELLGQLNPVNVEDTHARLCTMLEGLMEASPPPNQHLEVIEAARETIELVQEQLASRYAARPLPPETSENATLVRVIRMWRLLADAYAHVTRKDAASGTLDDQRALLSQRRVYYSGMVLVEYFRAHRQLPPGIWGELHESFMIAEAQGVATTRVGDTLNEVWRAQSASEAFISYLLIDLSNPFGRSEREFRWICRWAKRFAPYCALVRSNERKDESKPTAYGLDLNDDHGLRPAGVLDPEAKSIRLFEGDRLASQIRAVLNQFKQGTKPAALGLGEDCPLDATGRLLLSLYRPWGLASAGRRFPRRGGRGHVELTGDWLAIGFHVQGKRFEQPGSGDEVRSLRSDISLLTFGERAAEVSIGKTPRERQREAEHLGFGCEQWEILDQSVGGFRLRQHPTAERLEHHQLVGLRPSDGERFLLGQICWLMYRADGTLDAGISMLNGIPRMIAIRKSGPQGSGRGAYQLAFALPEVPRMQKPATLVLPGGWYQPHRVIEIHGHTPAAIRLLQLIQRGTNFDQVSFEPVSAAS